MSVIYIRRGYQDFGEILYNFDSKYIREGYRDYDRVMCMEATASAVGASLRNW